MSPTPTSSLLEGKRLLVTGIVTTHSIAFATAAAAIDAGAELLLTGLPRDLHLTFDAAAELPGTVPVIGADLTLPADLAAVRAAAADRWGHLDGALHAVAFAPRGALSGDLLATEFADVSRAVEASTYSYAALAAVVRDLAPPTGASIVGLDFDAAGAWPVYNWMGVCKAGLEAVSRYVARDLGPLGIRSNLIAAGPIRTRAAGGIADFEALLDAWEHGSPLPWDDQDSRPVADAACFLLSDLGRMITGEILHVDGGYHAMAAPLRPREPSRDGAVRPSSEATSPVGAAR